jgi:hypothetical protein
MLIRYYLEGVEFAARTRDLVPSQNETIRFNGDLYLIETVVWVEDEEREYVAIDIERT